MLSRTCFIVVLNILLAGMAFAGVPEETYRQQLILAEHGSADSAYSVGSMYEDGTGVAQSYADAAAWYRKAAEQGDARAQIALATLYLAGQGVPQDDVIAQMWLEIAAAARPSSPAASARDDYAKKLTVAQLAEARRLALEFEAKPIRSLPAPPPQVASNADARRCAGYGFRAGTDGFANCLQELDVHRQDARTNALRAIGGAFKALGQQGQATIIVPAPAPPLLDTQTTCNWDFFGNWVCRTR